MNWAQVLAIVLPVMFTIVIGIFFNNRRIDDLRSDMNQRFADMNQRFVDMNQAMNQRFADMNQRFVDMREDIKELKSDIKDVKNLLTEFLKKEAGI